jgi:rubrerythrin
MAAVTPVFAVENPPSDKVLQSLQVAFNSENNAKVRYEAFALRADQDGYGQIASLFRTAAKAEGFHARNFSTEINRLGGTQLGETDSPTVKSTKENLEAAIQAETYERDIMYPEFRQVAQNLYQMDAVRTINFAYNGEVSHVILLTEAYSNLETKLGTHNTYYVCSECGYTTKDAPKSACHACYSAEEKFTKVS